MTKSTLRDRIIHRIITFVMSFATEEYRERTEFVYVLGMSELERRRDANKNRAMLGNDEYEETR